MDIDIKLMVVLTKLNSVFLSKLGKDLERLGMQTSTYSMLAHLNATEKEKTQRLGEVALITSGTITHVVNKMIKDNYVVKIQDESDKRIYWVQITDQGRQAFLKVHEEHLKFLHEILGDLSDEEKALFIDQVKYIGKKINKQDQ